MRKAVVRRETTDDTKFFINEVMDKTGLSEADAENAVDVMISVIPKALKNADSVEFPHIGTWRVEYKANQPRPGDEHYKIVKFEAAPGFENVAGSCRTRINP